MIARMGTSINVQIIKSFQLPHVNSHVFLFGEKVLCFHFLANLMISSGFWGQFRNVGSSWLASHMSIPIEISS
jgi:hypothetical protein